MNKKAYINGRIYKGKKSEDFSANKGKEDFCDTLITANNRIVFAGKREEAEREGLIGKGVTINDLKGGTIIPGFIDSHAHIIMGGFYLLGVDLQPAKTHEEFVSILKKFVKENGKKWITGGNWNEQNWKTPNLPSREWVDEFSTETPIFVSRMDYHMAFANSKALNLAGITKDTQNPEGGEIVRDKVTGEATGILKDKAMELVQAVIPKPSETERERAALRTLKEARKYGVTSIHDICYEEDFRILQKLEREGKLSCRIFARLPIERTEAIISAQIEAGFGSEKLKTGSLKGFADGSLGSGTALFFEPYADDSSNYGLAMEIFNNGQMREWILKGDRANLQMSIHAIGDKANSKIIDYFEEAIQNNKKWDRRFRIEHAQHLDEKDFGRIGKAGIIVSAQPYHMYDDGSWAEKKIGKERLKRSFAFRSMIDNGIRLCFGSDFPVVTINPLAGVYAAVTRHTSDGKNPEGLIPEEKISVYEAIEGYTAGGAYASFEERIKGRLEEGMLADFVVLSENIFEIEEDKIKDVAVIQTVFDGETIFEA